MADKEESTAFGREMASVALDVLRTPIGTLGGMSPVRVQHGPSAERLLAAAFTQVERLAREDERKGPVDVVLFCPACGHQHIDEPNPAAGWENPPHKSHLCRPDDGGCGIIWRPADVYTNGVATASTRGTADTWPRAT